MSDNSTDPAIIAFVDQTEAGARDLLPEKSPEWRRVYLPRLFHHRIHGGDMAEAPRLPDEGRRDV
jgi:hypothetical protein